MTFVHLPTRGPTWTLSATLAALAAWTMLALASPATAGTPCYKRLINDWLDNGRIDRVYATPCYKEALQKLPEDLRDYSSLPDDINRALLAATHGSGRGPRSGSGGGSNPSSGSSGIDGGSDPTASGVLGQKAGPDSRSRVSGRAVKRPKSEGFFRSAIDWVGPKNADSIPLPLIILTALALLLLAAGSAGFVARRIQSRRTHLRPAPAPRVRPRDQ